MPQADINYWAVVVAGISAMVVGYIWYARPIFGNTWMKLVGKTEEDLQRGAGPAYAGMLVLALILAFVLAHFVDYAQADTFGEAVVTGLWLWLGFVVTTKGADYLFAHKPFKLYLIDVGYHVVEIVVMASILTLWK